MARVTLVNSTAPQTVQYNAADSDQYDRAHLAYLSENYDVHTHRATYGLGVGRLTTTAVAAACDVAISGTTLTWKDDGNVATYVAMSLSGTQTVTGVKTFSGNNTHSGTLAISGVATFTASPIIDSSYRIHIGSGGTNTDISLQRTATRTLTIAAGPNVDTTGIVVSVGTTGTDSELNVFGVIKTPTSLRLGVAGTTNDIAITKTGANAIKIDSFPTTGTANAVTIGSSGTSNSLTIYGSIILSSGSYVQAETLQTGGGAAMVINPGGALSLFAGSASGWKVDTGSAKALYPSVDNTFDIGINGTNDVRAIYLQTDIYKAGSAYTNPDFVFEHHFTGRVSEKNKQGAKKYKGRKSLDAVRDHVRQNHRFETIPDKQTGMFERGDIALELLEEAYLHMFDLHDRIKVLEAR